MNLLLLLLLLGVTLGCGLGHFLAVQLLQLADQVSVEVASALACALLALALIVVAAFLAPAAWQTLLAGTLGVLASVVVERRLTRKASQYSRLYSTPASTRQRDASSLYLIRKST